DRGSLPPFLFVGHPEDREMQVRRVARRVAGGADETNHVAALDRRAFLQAFRVALEMRVVVDEGHRRVVLIDRDASRVAQEQARDLAVLDRQYWRIARRKDVERFVLARAPTQLVEVAVQLRS